MMKLFATCVLATVWAAAAPAADVKYALTGENTKIEWTGTKSAGKHVGGFKTIAGVANVSGSSGISFDVEIDCDSLYSDDQKLTNHLKSPDFFAVKDHPKAKFVSKKVVKNDKNHTVTGDLTILGKTKEISFPAEISTDGGLKLTAEFDIDRTDYGMNYGGGKIDNKVQLKVTVDAK